MSVYRLDDVPFRWSTRTAAVLTMLLSGCLLGGCTLLDDGGLAPSASDRAVAEVPIASQDVIAEDFTSAENTMVDDVLDVLVQLRPARDTTVQVGPHTTVLGDLLISELSARGYGIQRVEADQGANLLGYSLTPSNRSDGSAGERLQLTLGEIALSRRYERLDAGGVVPTDPMEIAGSRLPVVLDDTVFGDAVVEDASVSAVRYTSAAPVDMVVPVISLVTPEVVQRVTNAATGRNPSAQAVNSARVEVNNRFYGGESAFGAVTADLERLDRQVVIFPDDSMRLGELGKQQIMLLATQFSEQTDIISLVGCSNGPTRLEMGNEGLALGRSQRVSEELMSLGIAREKILDEGCWSPVSAGERFPSRGVVIELLRGPA